LVSLIILWNQQITSKPSSTHLFLSAMGFSFATYVLQQHLL
jgi:hypothetical protein